MTEASSAAGRANSDEIVSLGERMGLLQALRAALAAIVLASGLFASDVVGAEITDLMLVTSGYLLLSAAVEGVRRLGRGRGLAAVGGMLLMDGVYLAWVMYQTGATLSPLRFLVYLHLIAVTLLASYRTGLKVALWHSLLFFVVFYAQAARILEPLDPDATVGASFEQPSFFNVVAFWLVALVTTVFSSINERELRRRKADLESLAAMARALENVDDPKAIGNTLLAGVTETFGFGRGAVLATPTGEEPELLAYNGPGEASEAKPNLDASIQKAWGDRRPVLLRKLDPADDPYLSALLPFASNVIILPLSAEGQPVGALVVERPGTRAARIERRVVDMANQFASHAALALRNAWLMQQVRKMAETDSLTGIANRRTFQTILEREVARATRNGEQVTLVMLDVDHFKDLNDSHGHQTGDEVLKHVASSLVDNSRSFDTAARYGGEEFAVILPACSPQEALIAGERLRKGIAVSGAPVPVTASAGIATFPIHAGTPDALVRAADEALYESKRAGRDRLTRSRRTAPVGEPLPKSPVSDRPSAEKRP